MNIIHLIRRVPKVGFIFPLLLLAGLAEGIGISALVPVMSTLTGDMSIDSLPVPFNVIPKVLSIFGNEVSFGLLLWVTLGIMILSFLLIHLQDRAVYWARYKFLGGIRKRAADAIFKSSWESMSSLSSGDITNQVIHESERGSEALMGLMAIIATAIQLSVYAIFAFLLSWKMFSIAMLTMVIAAFTGRRLIKAVRRLGQQATNINTLFSRQLVDYMRGGKLLKATATENSALDHLTSSNRDACKTFEKILVSQSKMRFEIQAILSIAMVAILYTAIEVFSIKISILAVFLYIILRIAPKFSTLQGQFHNYSSFKPALEVVDKLISDCEKLEEAQNSEGLKFDGINQSIELRNVRYQYPQTSQDVICGVNIKIPSQGFVALVGKTGGGKSTAVDLIIGLLKPLAGHVAIDNTDLRQFNQLSYRERIGFVSQDSIFFTGTIRENICLFHVKEDRLIWDCLKIAQIDDFVKGLSDGLETDVGEAGVKLSGGQKQRLAIARALLRSPELLVLDEATSALDSESEVRFQQAIESVAHRYSIIVIAHRLSTIKKADWIYVLEDGKVAEEGTYDQLFQQNGRFTGLVEAQKSTTG